MSTFNWKSFAYACLLMTVTAAVSILTWAVLQSLGAQISFAEALPVGLLAAAIGAKKMATTIRRYKVNVCNLDFRRRNITELAYDTFERGFVGAAVISLIWNGFSSAYVDNYLPVAFALSIGLVAGMIGEIAWERFQEKFVA